MHSAIKISVFLALGLAATEGLAWWWMHPAPAGLDEPVLTYQPFRGTDVSSESSSAVLSPTSPSTHNPQPSTTSSQLSDFSDSVVLKTTHLPEVVARTLPTLRCSAGTAARIDRGDGATIHLAFFEWNLADSPNVLEAFKHLPEECMGSIGMTLTEKRSPRSYQIGSETLSFDHTVFRDPAGVVIHAFKGTWVSGASNLLGDGLRGGSDQWRQIRWKAALKRFRPAYARVAQGAVRGVPNPDIAWETFEALMLSDLKFQ